MIAITTKYHGPTETRGARIVATAHDGAKKVRTWAYDHSISATQNHHAAAMAWVIDNRPEWCIWAEGLGAPGTAVSIAGPVA